MIKLKKLPEPAILSRNAAEWLRTLEEKIANGETPTDAEKSRYRHLEIKEILKLETHGKCAYCESRLLHIAFGDVEHIAPKSLKIADTFRWDNLTLACDVCNTYKKDASDIVDPYVDEPEDIFKFVGPMVYARPESEKAVLSSKQLRMNRAELVASRTTRLNAISSILLTAKLARSERERQAIIDDLLANEAGDSGEYAAFVRSFLKVVAPEMDQSRQTPGSNASNDS